MGFFSPAFLMTLVLAFNPLFLAANPPAADKTPEKNPATEKPAPKQADLELHGMVFNQDGAPAAKVRVVVVKAPPKKKLYSGQMRPLLADEGILKETESDEAGSFSFALDPDQNFFLVALQENKGPAFLGPFGPDHPDAWDPSSQVLELKITAGFAAQGLVLDGPGGKPLSKVTVTAWKSTLSKTLGPYTPPGLFAHQTQTDAQGKYQLNGLSPGTWRLVFSRKDRATRSLRKRIDPGQELPAISMALGSALNGQVKDKFGAPVAGAIVRFSPRRENQGGWGDLSNKNYWDETFRGRSDDKGYYSVSGLPLSTGFARCGASTYGGDTKGDIKLTSAQGETWNPTLSKQVSVHMKVVEQGTEEPLPDVRAAVFNTAKAMPFVEESDMEGISDAKGIIHIDNMEPGNHYMHLYPVNSVAPKPIAFNVSEGQRDRDLGVVVLEKGLAVKGQVKNEAGDPIEGVTVRTDVGVFKSSRSDEEGQFVLRGLEEGDIDLWAEMDGYITKRFPTPVPNSEALEVTLTETARLKVRLLVAGPPNTDPKPAKRALVGLFSIEEGESNPWAMMSRAQRRELEPQEDGWFELKGVKPGSYHLEFVLPDGKPKLVKEQDFTAGKTTHVDEQVLSMGRALWGKVLDGTTRIPVEGAVLLGVSDNLMDAARGLYTQNGEDPPTSDSNGRFHLGGLPEEGGNLLVRHASYAPRTIALSSLDPNASELEILLEQGGTLFGSVNGLPEETEAMVSLNAEGQRFNFMSMGGTLYSAVEQGKYRIEHIPSGTYRAMVSSRVSGSHNSDPVEITDGVETEFDIDLTSNEVKGILSQGGQPLPDTQLILFPTNSTTADLGMNMKQTTTDGQGKFSVGGIEPETQYQPVVTRQGEGSNMVNILAPANPPLADTDWLLGLGSSSIEVTFQGLEDEAQVSVVALVPDPGTTPSVFNQVPGYRTVAQINAPAGQPVILDGLEPGTYSLLAQSGTLRVEQADVQTDSGSPVELTFSDTMSVTVTVTDSQGQPVQGAFVLMMGPGGEGPMAALGMTDITGEIKSDEVGEGAYSMWAVALGQGTSAPLQVDFTGKSQAEETLVIPIAGSVEVTVVDNNGVAQPGVLVQVEINGIRATEMLTNLGQMFGSGPTTDANGIAHLKGLPGGNYRFVAPGPLGDVETTLTLETGEHTTVTLEF